MAALWMAASWMAYRLWAVKNLVAILLLWAIQKFNSHFADFE